MRRWISHGVLAVGALLFGASASSRDTGTADPLNCPDGTVARVARALGFGGDSTDWPDSTVNACRLDPEHGDRAFVALTYVPGGKDGKVPDKLAKDDRDLDVAVFDLTQGKVLSHVHEAKAVEDDANNFVGISIDTARYILAPGLRAFGVSVGNASQCMCDNDSSSYLSLYLPRGDRLDKVADIPTYAWQAGHEKGEDAAPACTETSSTTKAATSVGKTSSHGLADLLVVETKTQAYNDEDPSKCPAIKPTKTSRTFRFDGTSYK